MGIDIIDGPAIFCGELFCDDCQEKYSEDAAARTSNEFFCPECGRWIGRVESSFGTISLTPFRFLQYKLPPGFYLTLHDDNALTFEELIKRGTVTLVYKNIAAVKKWPITVNPDAIVQEANNYLEKRG